MTARLNKTDWLHHGLKTLAAEGVGALKAATMAEALGVSRGSFYWHFEDIDAFRGEVLAYWRQRMTDGFIERLEAEAAASDRFDYLTTVVFDIDQRLDTAIRHWAGADPQAAAVVAQVDSDRIAYVAGLLEAAGAPKDKAMPRATFIYWAYLGKAGVMQPALASIARSDIEAIGALFKGL